MATRIRRKQLNVRSMKNMAPNWKLPFPSNQTTVGVQSVQPHDGQTLDWGFTQPVQSVTSAALVFDATSGVTTSNVPQLQASADGVTYVSPTSVTLVNGAIRAVYASPVLPPGSIFNVTATPTGMTFAAGALIVPQAGQVTTPPAAEEVGEEAVTLRIAGTPRAKTRRTTKQGKAVPARRAA